MKKKLLAVATNQATYGETDHPTGLWLSELVHFYDGVTKAGYQVDLISPTGGKVPLDPRSLGRLVLDNTTRGYLEDAAFMSKLDHSRPTAHVNPDDYVAVFYTGGHGVMWDFPDNGPLQQLSQAIYEDGGVVSSVCHGACGLLNITLPDGSPLVSGRTVTGFATAEERVVRVKNRVPFLLEDELRNRCANYVKAKLPLLPFAVADGRLVTGQNPYSTKVATTKLLEVLGASPRSDRIPCEDRGHRRDLRPS